ncbi:hypothetical protein K2173_025007 [Erythroxylum novogranatense]|uniref:Sterol methyltransferase C-terminal domain-containing protein n=1 Tax=Erythroxylum novogranatense TaxID=1862640 RepID=A0AAV8UGL5_9ROSI|nr:hypothetical protein K2173_025007 [Erythroxylum novogranatense]
MSKASPWHLVSDAGGKIEKSEIHSAVERYKNYHTVNGGEEEKRRANYVDLVSLLEFLGLAAKGSREVSKVLETGGDAMVVGGK